MSIHSPGSFGANASKTVVAKFGGSSMADFSCMRRCSEIALSHNASVVVVSAMKDVTNQLEEMLGCCLRDEYSDISDSIEKLFERHWEVLKQTSGAETGVEFLTGRFKRLKTLLKGVCWLGECSPRAKDEIVGMGEIVSSWLMYHVLRDFYLEHEGGKDVYHLDAREIIQTTEHGKNGKVYPVPESIAKHCSQTILPFLGDRLFVAGGFVGRDSQGRSTTLGRGGSDLSAALFAEGVQADELHIWTDVAGMVSVDPRLIPYAVPIKEVSYDEAAELAHYGAKILHPTTLTPLQRKNIPVYVGSTFEPDKSGTWIKKEVQSSPIVRGLAVKNDQKLIVLTSPRMYQTHGFVSRVFSLFDQYELSVDAITTSEITIACTLDSHQSIPRGFLDQLESLGKVEIEEGLCLVSLVGNAMDRSLGLGEKIFRAAGPRISIRMLCQGASPHHIGLLIKHGDQKDFVEALYNQLIAVSYAQGGDACAP